ncbi:HAMP domain-containing protein [Paracoccus sp. M683]|uniref:ATP-binding protein n=1 Tax=Paracoccus sp. M683 TaxID=2594268 RepID=UPI00117F9922|nr:ATP-binding protein [Paracoccus sp. M683]TRW99378.1 HAMP domain-containing protein [Paracoccus sp. M683]
MTSLRARITALLIAAILAVVGLATFAASRALQPPPPETTIEPIARQIHLLAALAQTAPQALRQAGGTVQDQPAAGGEVLERMSRFLTRALDRTGPPRSAIVNRTGSEGTLTASVALDGGGWLITPVPDPAAPDNQWRSLAVWLAVIVTGSGALSFYAARRLTRPLELLEGAASRIGADATLSKVDETGPAEVRATAQALNRLSERLAHAMDSRMRLVAAAGHDLRTPMTRMRLRAEFIEDDTDRDKWLADLAELDQIADSAIRLVREEASTADTQPLRLDILLTEIVGEMAELGHRLRMDPMPATQVRAGPIALKRALRNLILNAATHGGGAQVALSQSADHAQVTIRDQGPGIPADLLGQVFEPFFRVDPSRAKTLPGAGLGLAIAREIIERFGGTIAIRNLSPRGLLQQISLPMA